MYGPTGRVVLRTGYYIVQGYDVLDWLIIISDFEQCNEHFPVSMSLCLQLNVISAKLELKRQAINLTGFGESAQN